MLYGTGVPRQKILLLAKINIKFLFLNHMMRFADIRLMQKHYFIAFSSYIYLNIYN